MFISVKDTLVKSFHEAEWECRRKAKGLDKPAYWAWLESVTTDNVPDYSGEDFEIHETEFDVKYFNVEGYIHREIDEGIHYHLKWDGSKVIADDAALATCQTASKWKNIRGKRDRYLAESDWVVIKAKETGGNVSSAWKTYRQDLRDVPSQSDPDDITWPTKPS
mgnify:CR=1 FL=1